MVTLHEILETNLDFLNILCAISSADIVYIVAEFFCSPFLIIHDVSGLNESVIGATQHTVIEVPLPLFSVHSVRPRAVILPVFSVRSRQNRLSR